MEVADEMALRTFDLHPVGNPDGGMTGLRDMDLDALAASAVGQVIAEALRAAQPATGLRWSHTTGPCVRPQDDPSGGGS